jgi:hypothetical protein
MFVLSGPTLFAPLIRGILYIKVLILITNIHYIICPIQLMISDKLIFLFLSIDF